MSTETSLPETEVPTRGRQRRLSEKEGTENASPSLMDIFVILVERRKFVTWFTGLSLVVGVAVALLIPTRYSAAVALLPPQQNSSVAATIASQLGNLGGVAGLAGSGLGLKNPNDMYVAMLRSRTVEDAMIQRFGLLQEYGFKRMSDCRKRLERRTAIENGAKDGLIHLSVSDSNPNRAAELANGYVDQLRKLSEHLAISEASQRRLFFEGQLEEAKDNLANAEEALKRTQQSTGLIQLDSQARALIESAAALRAQIAGKEVEVRAMENYATGQNSQLTQAQSELQALQQELAKLGGSTQSTAEGGEIIVPKGQVTRAGLEYVRKIRDVKYYETIFEILARQFELAKLDEAKQGALIQVVDTAVPPDKKSFPPRILISLGIAFLGLIAAIITVSIQDSWVRIKSDPIAAASLSRLHSSWSGAAENAERE